MQDFRNLQVWKAAHAVTLDIYRMTQEFPQEERYGLTSQVRRSAVSIPSNIAEGCGRGSDADFARFVQIAMGSASELEYQILLADDLAFMHSAESQTLIEKVQRVKRMLIGLHKKLTANSR